MGNARSDEAIILRMLESSLWEVVCLGFSIWKKTLPSAQHIVILACVIEPLRGAAPEHGGSINAANDQWQPPAKLGLFVFLVLVQGAAVRYIMDVLKLIKFW